MKKTIIILSIVFVACGCSLKEKLLDTATPDESLTTEEALDAMVGGMYGYISSTPGYKCNINIMQSCYADIESVYNVSGVGSKLSISQKNFDPSAPEIQNCWTTYYKVISDANELLSRVDKLELPEEAAARILGQAYFMRAFCYFNLVRFFGEVPLFLTATDYRTDFYKPASSIDAVYTAIFADFALAATLLPDKSEQDKSVYTHANRQAAQAFDALAYLTYGNMKELRGEDAEEEYQVAADLCEAVIISGQYGLTDDFATLWNYRKEEDSYDREVIFGLSYCVDKSVTGKPSCGSELANLYNPAHQVNVAGNTTAKRGWGHIRIQPWFYDFATSGDYEGDYRAEVSFKTSFEYLTTGKLAITYPETYPYYASMGDYSAQKMPYLKKYESDVSLANNDPNDLFLMRMAEVYLIKAEALNELGTSPSEEAYNAFNMLRQRARRANGVVRATPEDLPAGLTKDEFRLAISNERAVEFVGEGHRWFDLVRMKAPSGSGCQTMMEYQIEQINLNYYRGLPVPTIDKNTVTWDAGRFDSLSIPDAFRKRFLIFPKPQSELRSNSNLKQNTEYGW